MKINVYFDGFYPKFDFKNHPLSKFIEIATESEIRQVKSLNDDFQIRVSSNFGSGLKSIAQRKLHALARKLHLEQGSKPWLIYPQNSIQKNYLWIYWSGENLDYPIGPDIYLGFKENNPVKNHYYTPLWTWSLDWFNSPNNFNNFLGEPVLRDTVTGPRDTIFPDKFACAFFGHLNKDRKRLLHLMEQFGQVDVYGPAGSKRVETKNSLKGQYKYILCPENSISPGYVTEKILEAWSIGAVPVWWGDDKFKTLNDNAYFNLRENAELQMQKIASLDANAWCHIANQEIVRKIPDLNFLVPLIRDQLSKK